MLNLEERVAYLEGRLEDHSGTLTGLRHEVAALRVEVHGLRQAMDARFQGLDQKVDRHFAWLVGTQVSILLAVVGTLVGSFFS